MRRFRDFFEKEMQEASGIPTGPMPTPAHPMVNLPNFYAPQMPLTGWGSMSSYVHHKQLEEKPDLQVFTSLSRLANNIYSSPDEYDLTSSSFRNGLVVGIPTKLVLNPSSLSSGEGKLTAAQLYRAKELGLIVHPTSINGDPDFLDFNLNNLSREMRRHQDSQRISHGAASAYDTIMAKMVEPGQHSQQLQRSQYGV